MLLLYFNTKGSTVYIFKGLNVFTGNVVFIFFIGSLIYVLMFYKKTVRNDLL